MDRNLPAESAYKNKNEGFPLAELITSWVDYLGIALYVIGVLCIITVAFEKSTGTGCAMLLLGAFIWPIFVMFNWQKTSFWFFVALTGSLLVYVF